MIDFDRVRRDFESDGCAVIPGFLNDQELHELRMRTDNFLKNWKTDIYDSANFAGTLKNMNVHDSWFKEKLLHGKQAKLIAELLNDELEPATAAFFDRVPGETTAIPPHFDAIGHRRKGATIWIALDKADTQNGCLYYTKGTHLQRLEGKVGLAGFDAATPGAFPVELDPGDAAIHSTLTVHWSYPNTSNRPRRAVSFFYWAASSKPDPDMLAKKKERLKGTSSQIKA